MNNKSNRNSNNSIVISFFSAIIFVLVLSIPFSCSFKEPVAPQWDVNLPIPLINKTLTVQELIDKNEFLILNPNGLVSIDFEEELDRYEVGDKLRVEGINETFTSKIGKIELESPGSSETSLTLAEIFPPSTLLNGQTVPVPGFSFNNISASLGSYDNFRSILIESGSIQITLANNLPIPLSSGAELQVRSLNTNELVFTILFDEQVDPGSTISRGANLAGLRIPSDLKIVLSGGSPGSGVESVLVDAYSAGINIDVDISKIVATEATAKIDQQQFEGNDSFVLGDSIVVTQATISSGRFNLEYENHIPLNLNVDLHLQDFYDQSGQPVHVFLPIRSNENGNQNIDISGFEFKPPRNENGSIVRFSWDVQVESSHGEFITVTSEDNFSLDVEMPEITFTELRGILKDIRIELESFEESIDLPEGLDSLTFESARMELIVNNGIGFPIRPELKIVGSNASSGGFVELPINQAIQAATEQPVESVISLNENNSQILEFLKVSPDQLLVDGFVVLGDGQIESDISSTDFIETSVHITVPLSLSFPSQTIKTDIDTIEIEEDVQDELRENVLSGKLFVELNNHLPLGFDVSLHFSSQDTSVYTNAELTIGPLSLQSAQISSVSGRVESETPSEIVVELTQEEIAMFANREVYIGISAYLPGSNGQMYRIFADDYLNIKAYCEFKYHVDPEKMGE